MSETKTMQKGGRAGQTFLEALSERARHLTLLRGRLLLGLKCCLGDGSHHGPEQWARDLVTAGITLARLGLWVDASYQWRRAVQLDPLNSDARNNLAVAYELQGKSALAEAEYERALSLESDNVYIRQNYELHRRTLAAHRAPERHTTTTTPALCH